MTSILNLLNKFLESKPLIQFSGFIIPTFCTLFFNVHKYLTSDYYIQKFYSSHTIQLLARLTIPIKFILLNIFFTILTFITTAYLFFNNMVETNQIKKSEFNMDIFIQNLFDSKHIKEALIILTLFSLFIAGIQLIVLSFVNISKNEHLKIKKSNLYILSNDLQDIYPNIPKNTKIYLGHKYKKEYILGYFYLNDLPYRITIPEQKILKSILIPTEKETIFTVGKELKIMLKNKVLSTFIFIITPIFLLLTTQNFINVIIYLSELVLLLSPLLIKKLIHIFSPIIKKATSKYTLIPKTNFKNKNTMFIADILKITLLIILINIFILITMIILKFISINNNIFFILSIFLLSLLLAILIKIFILDKE